MLDLYYPMLTPGLQETRQVEVYRADREVERLGDGDMLSIPDLLPGWDVAIADLWPLVFE